MTRQPPQPPRTCTHCGAALGVRNESGFCQRCRARFRCQVCDRICPGKPRGLCPDCKRLQADLSAAHNEGCVPESEPVAVARGRRLRKIVQP